MFQSHYSSRSNIIGLSLLNLKTAECQFSLPCCTRKQFAVWSKMQRPSLPRVPPQASQWSRSGLRGSQPPHFSFFPLCLSIFMQREQKHFFSCSTLSEMMSTPSPHTEVNAGGKTCCCSVWFEVWAFQFNVSRSPWQPTTDKWSIGQSKS